MDLDLALDLGRVLLGESFIFGLLKVTGEMYSYRYVKFQIFICIRIPGSKILDRRCKVTVDVCPDVPAVFRQNIIPQVFLFRPGLTAVPKRVLIRIADFFVY